jgi:hypothetical protein
VTWGTLGGSITACTACMGLGNVVWVARTWYDTVGGPMDMRVAGDVEYVGL